MYYEIPSTTIWQILRSGSIIPEYKNMITKNTFYYLNSPLCSKNGLIELLT